MSLRLRKRKEKIPLKLRMGEATMSVFTSEIERRNDITILRMARGAVNALDLDAVERLADTLARLAEDDTIGALVLTGAGPAFSAGLDLKAVPGYARPEQRALVEGLNRLFGGLYQFPVPTVAAINGHAIAGGMVLALACDHRICTRGKATLGLSEVKAGVPYPVAAIEVARGELSPAAARAMVLFGRLVGADQALAWGVIDELAEPESLLDRAIAEAMSLAQLPRGTYGQVKRQLRGPALARIKAAIETEEDPTLETWLTAETRQAAEGILLRGSA